MKPSESGTGRLVAPGPTDPARHIARVGFSTWIASALAADADCLTALARGAVLVRVSGVHRDRLAVHDGRHERPARVPAALWRGLAAGGDALAVGDWVLVHDDAAADCWVAARVPRRSEIARRSTGQDGVQRLVVAANVDTLVVVTGLDHDFNLRRLERYAALVRSAGVAGLVVLGKADRAADVAAAERAARAVLPADVPTLALNALDGAAVRARLAPWLGAGQTLAFIGSSGVGKSTLTNALIGDAVQPTGGVREDDSRGRHTTTARSLHLAASGACVIDTPGLRTVRLDADADEVAGAFDDIATLAAHCRFRDCRHDHEPGCAVREGVGAQRLRGFRKLMREAQRDTLTLLERREELAVWKRRAKASKARALEKGRER